MRQSYSFAGDTESTHTTQAAAIGASSRQRVEAVIGDLIVFTIPALLFLEIQIVGRLFVSELILLGLLPFLVLSEGRLLTAPLPRIVILFGLFWLLGLVVTDLIRSTPFVDYARGWSKIAFFLTNFTALYLLLSDSQRRIILYTAGLVIGGVLDFYLSPVVFAEADPWKFGVGGSVTLLLVLFATHRAAYRTPLPPGVVIGFTFLFILCTWVFSLLCLNSSLYTGCDPWKLGIAGSVIPLLVLVAQHRFFYRASFLAAMVIGFAALLNLYMGFRSFAGICFLTAVYVFTQHLGERQEARRVRLSVRNLVFFSLVLLGVGVASLKGYEYAAAKGLLGKQAQAKYERQASGALGVFFGGRSEIFISARAILDSPIIGHGSWAKDPEYVWQFIESMRSYGYEPSWKVRKAGLIPTHSHLFGAWVEGGVLGGVFWLWVLFLAARGLFALYWIRGPLTPLIAFVGFLLVWDVLFSPFGAERRFVTPFYIIALMSVLGAPSAKQSDR
jgi:hypothetical protein